MQERTLRVLEFYSVAELLSEQAVCYETKERCKALKPTDDIYEADRLLHQTEEGEALLIKKGALPISPVRNITGCAKRCASGGVLSMGELLSICHVLRISREIRAYSSDDSFEENYPCLFPVFSSLVEQRKLENEISRAILSEEEMADDASSELLSIRRKMHSLNSKVRDVLNEMIRSPHIAPLLQEPIVSMRGDRYVIPVKSEHKGSIRGIVHDSSATGQTLFIEPMQAVEINNKLRSLISEEKEEIERILASLSGKVEEYSQDIIADYRAITELDFIFAKSRLARKMNATRPNLNTDGIIDIKKARHPLIDPKKVVPTDVYLGRDFDTLVITGPNTGGKTVSIKTIGLFTLMAQSGLMLPCASDSEIGVFEEVFADIGDEQSIEQSLSTFSAHITNIINILDKANYRSLILFDELCSGTDPIEGAALAISILERARSIGAKTAATTHYSEIKIYALQTDRVENGACEFDVSSLRPTYRLLIGVPGKSNAFAISKRLGLPQDIIDHAQSLVDGESTKFEDVIEALEKNAAEAERALLEAESEKEATLSEREQAEKERKQISRERERLLASARKDAKKIYEQAKKEADRIVSEMQKMFDLSASDNRKNIENARRELKKKLDNVSSSLQEDVFSSNSKEKLDPGKITLGQVVEVTTMNQSGNVLTLPDKKGNLTVQVGILKIKTNVSMLAPGKKEKKKNTYQSFVVGTARDMGGIRPELDLRGETVDDALYHTDQYLDDASLAHFETVSIIHGKGTGALRSAICDMLRHHPHVKSFRGGKYGEGDAGVTVVELK